MIQNTNTLKGSRQQSNVPSRNRTFYFHFNLKFIIKCKRNRVVTLSMDTDIQFRRQQKRIQKAHTHTKLWPFAIYFVLQLFLIQAII